MFTTLKMPIRQIIVEGCDRQGKSTLIRELHKQTSFKYNIHDRSCMSMLCYSRLYDRGEDMEAHYRRMLSQELSDLNNFYIVMMLPLEENLRRLRKTGDEFQDEESLRKLYNIFAYETNEICSMPNVTVIRTMQEARDIAQFIRLEDLDTYENSLPDLFSATRCSLKSENQFTVNINVSTDHFDDFIMTNEREAHYYAGIIQKCIDTIDDEYAGKNIYGVPQDDNSRRFYYSSDTCISSIHFLPRNSGLKVLCTLRSTDAKKNGELDIRFLAHLSALIPRTFGWKIDNDIELIMRFNSSHIRND